MKCPHCLVEFHARRADVELGRDACGSWWLEKYHCPNCKRFCMYLVCLVGDKVIVPRRLIHPKGTNRAPVPPEVPEALAEDYVEACLVVADSPKASAALSRRCLQTLLREYGGASRSSLAKEIEDVISDGRLPSHLAEALDMVREVGNFAAHSTKNEATGEIIPVEPQEAEWNLDVLEELFDFYFVRPKLVEQKKAQLNEKLQQAGRAELRATDVAFAAEDTE